MSSEKWDQERSRHFYFNSDWVVWCPEACEGEHPMESTYTVVRASTLSGANIEHIKNTGVILAWTNTIFSHHLSCLPDLAHRSFIHFQKMRVKLTLQEAQRALQMQKYKGTDIDFLWGIWKK